MIRGKINIKTIIILVVMLLVGVLAVLGMNTFKNYLSSASADYEPKGVITTPGDDGKSAVISWQSDKPSMGVVEYGTTPASLLLRAVETTETASHKISLTPLKANMSYYYRIRVGEETYDNNGIPFSFKTKAGNGGGDDDEAVPTAGAPTTVAPTLAAAPSPSSSSGTGTCNHTTDYNNDGSINSLDYLTCIRSGGSSNAPTGTAPVPTVASSSAVPTAAASCDNVDYDKNGVINSLDRIKCLQNQGR